MRIAKSLPVRIISHNVRYATNAPFEGEERWPIRSPRLCAELVFNATSPAETFICLQEVLHNQLEDIQEALNEAALPGASWTYIGVGRDDGKKAGEYSPIFYRASAWKLHHWKTAWLSETPERPSRGWDAACTRLVTIGFFQHRASGQEVIVMSTHLDHEGPVSRANSAWLILKLANEYQSSNGMQRPRPVLLAGDFNSPPDDEAYKIMTGPGSIMNDSRLRVPKGNKYGHDMTFTSFGERGAIPSLIDFIFSNDLAVVYTFAVLENRFDDGTYLSDHRAIVADLPCNGSSSFPHCTTHWSREPSPTSEAISMVKTYTEPKVDWWGCQHHLFGRRCDIAILLLEERPEGFVTRVVVVDNPDKANRKENASMLSRGLSDYHSCA